MALFFASGTVIASERPAQASFTNYQGAFVGCLSASPPEGFTDPGGWRQVIAVSPAAGHLVLVLVTEPRTVTDEPEALLLRVSDHDGGRLYEGPMFRPPSTR